MPSPSLSPFSRRRLSPLTRSRFAAFFAVPVVLVAMPASADECTSNLDCGFGFACETVVTSSISTGAGGAAGTSGASGSAGTIGSGGTGTGAASGAAPAGSGGTGSAPLPPVCGNLYCEAPSESPATCPNDCVYTTMCAPAPCADQTHCAAGYTCPTPGTVGTGGGPNVAFCGDMLCSLGEDTASCPVDCDPMLRRCTPGNRGCQSDLDCLAGYVCSGGGGTAGAGGSGSGGLPAGGTAGTDREEAPARPQGGGGFVGGTGGTAGGSAGIAGTSGKGGAAGAGIGGTATGGSAGTGAAGSAPVGGSAGYTGEGVCIPGGTGGAYGGTAGVGGDFHGGTAGTSAGGTGAVGGNGGSNGAGDDENVVVTDRGCSIANGGPSSSFGALLLGFAALFRLGRRRSSKRGR